MIKLSIFNVFRCYESLVKCKINVSLNQVIFLMMNCRATKVVIVDAEDKCLGILTIKDIIQHYV